MSWKAWLAAAILAITASTAAFAQSTLDEIIKRGTINVGTSLATPPYGLTSATMAPDGYDVDVAKAIARDLGVKLNVVDIVAANRIPSLMTNKVDIVISSFSITAERAKAIAFTNTVFVDQQVFFAKKDLAAASMDDLKGKKVGVTRTSTNDVLMTRLNLPDVEILRYDDDASNTQAMISGQVDGIVTAAGLKAALAEKAPDFEPKFVIAQAPMAIGLRRGDPDLLHWLNTEIFLLWTNGELQKIQERWMGSAVSELPRF